MAETYRTPLQPVYRDLLYPLPIRRAHGQVSPDEVLLPRRVRNGTILRAEVWREAVDDYEHHLIAKPYCEGVLLESWMAPRFTPNQMAHFRWKQLHDLAKVAGLARHDDFPSYLRKMSETFALKIQGTSIRETKRTIADAAYAPEGLWTFVPPTSGDDWSVRAQRVVQTGRPLPDLAAILMTEPHSLERLALRVTYDP